MKQSLFILCLGSSTIFSMMTPRLRTMATRNVVISRGIRVHQKRMFLDALKPFLIVHQSEKAIIERLGKFNRVVEPGLRFKMPVLENVRWADSGENRIDIRERVQEMSRQFVITKDNVAMGITALVYYKINDVQRSVYSIENLPFAINKLAQTTLRNLVGGLHLDETLTSRNQINTKLCADLKEAVDRWGIEVTRVELQEVNPPEDIRLAMEREMSAERNRRADILNAEGKKKASILSAEGIKESAILEAEGTAKARITLAEGEAAARIALAQAESQSIEKIQQALQQGMLASKYLQAMEYIKTLPKMMEGKAKTVIIPYEAQALANLTTSIKEIWETKD